MTMQIAQPGRHPLRFGRMAKPDEIQDIKTASGKASWKLKTVEPGLCFVKEESNVFLWKDIKRFINRVADDLKLRWAMRGQGVGFFPKLAQLQTPLDVYTLKRFPDAKSAQADYTHLQAESDAFLLRKAKMMAKVQNEKGYRTETAADLPKLKSGGFGLPNKWWLTPFSQLFPAPTKDATESHGPEHTFPTMRVYKVSDTVLLTRARLGPHDLTGEPGPEKPPVV